MVNAKENEVLLRFGHFFLEIWEKSKRETVSYVIGRA